MESRNFRHHAGDMSPTTSSAAGPALALMAAFLLVTAAHATPGPVSSEPARIPIRLVPEPGPLDFALVSDGVAAAVCVDAQDFKVVQIAAECFASDVALVTGRKPDIRTSAEGLAGPVLLAGTIGRSALVDGLVRAGKLDVSDVVGKWESFVVVTVADPLPGVPRALVVAGSDRRGTAFGLFTLSETVGVSPWVWWADVVPEKKSALFISGSVTSLPPSVTYRGIFLNDEDWGLHPWAAKTYEPETGDIGPKTYARVCELLLRLKANYLWPAMHDCTKAFNIYPGNKLAADDHAIVMGSSHCEQMLCNNVTEYDKERRGPWDFDQNRTNIMAYWRERLEANGKFENIYTVGMRGIHDSGMPGGGTQAEKTARLQRVIAAQRELIAQTVSPDPAQVPQIFCPYKEVLGLYMNGLQLPDDVTLVWPDDNHGYIRQLSTPAEQRRAGGAGVYYHISYWGAPEDYLWLGTTPPALVWEEMHKAWEQDARTLWVVNVGDIKPGEIGMEFFLRMAWDIRPWDEDAQQTYLADWAARNFGEKHAAETAAVLGEYYRLNFGARPEHIHLSEFAGDRAEAAKRLEQFAVLVKRADALFEKLPAEKRDAFFQLVLYPVHGASLVNETHLSGDSGRAMKAWEQIQKETRRYNEETAGGKWRHMMSSNPRKRPALRRPEPAAIRPLPEAPAKCLFAINAANPTRTTAGGETVWKTIAGLGRSGSCIALLPTSAAVPSEAALDFDFELPAPAGIQIQVRTLPTHPVSAGMRARYSISLDGNETRVVDITTSEFSKPWSTNVLRGAAVGSAGPVRAEAGKHTVRLRPLDPGLVFDRVEVLRAD